MAEERLQRALARAGFGSRRACEDLIRAGRVTVGREIARLGKRIDPATDEVAVDGHRVPVDPVLRYLAFHKPAGVVTTMADPRGRKDISSFLPEGPRVFPVGRLDRDTEGLLLLTNDGELANRVMHPRHGVEKEYLAEVEGSASGAQVSSAIRGVALDDGPARALRCKVVGRRGGGAALSLVMGEGRKREVRRLLAAVGLPVVRLVRLRVGPVKLGGLRAGEVRDLTPDEVRGLYLAAGL